MKYPKMEWGTVEAVINKLGGEEGVQRFLRGELVVSAPKVIKIDRTKPFDPKFVGEGFTIVKDDTDTRSTALTEVDLTKVRFETMLKGDETSVLGEEKLKRLKKAGHIRLDAKVFQTLWENKHLIPESWKEKVNGNTRFIYFDGTVLRDSSGYRCVLCLYWNDGRWYWHYYYLGSRWRAYYPSAVLAS